MDEKSKIEYEIKKADIDTLRTIVSGRTNLILTIATLAMGTMVIASFNEKIIPVTPELKFWLIVILTIIPILLWDHTFELASGQNKIMGKYDQKVERKNWLEDAIKSSSLLYLTLISIVIIAIIDLIASSFICTLIITIFDFSIIALLYKYKVKK